MQVDIPQDAEQPRLSAPRIAELRQVELRLAEGLLRYVFGVGSGAGQAVSIAVQGRVMRIDQTLHVPLTAGQPNSGTPSTGHDPGPWRFIPRRGEKPAKSFRLQYAGAAGTASGNQKGSSPQPISPARSYGAGPRGPRSGQLG